MTATEAEAGETVRARAMTERELQDAVIACAKLLGWRVYHTHDSRRSEKGYPDLTMVRRGCVIFAELKTEKGRLSVDQMAWISDLQATQDEAICFTDRDKWMDPTWGVYVWRPADWLDGTIEAVLRGEAP